MTPEQPPAEKDDVGRELAAFVRARLVERIDTALHLRDHHHLPSTWTAVGASGEDAAALAWWSVEGVALPRYNGSHARDLMQFIAERDPYRLLAESVAVDAVVRLWETADAMYRKAVRDGFDFGSMHWAARGSALEDVLRALAQVDSGHPDYRRKGWAP